MVARQILERWSYWLTLTPRHSIVREKDQCSVLLDGHTWNSSYDYEQWS